MPKTADKKQAQEELSVAAQKAILCAKELSDISRLITDTKPVLNAYSKHARVYLRGNAETKEILRMFRKGDRALKKAGLLAGDTATDLLILIDCVCCAIQFRELCGMKKKSTYPFTFSSSDYPPILVEKSPYEWVPILNHYIWTALKIVITNFFGADKQYNLMATDTWDFDVFSMGCATRAKRFKICSVSAVAIVRITRFKAERGKIFDGSKYLQLFPILTGIMGSSDLGPSRDNIAELINRIKGSQPEIVKEFLAATQSAKAISAFAGPVADKEIIGNIIYKDRGHTSKKPDPEQLRMQLLTIYFYLAGKEVFVSSENEINEAIGGNNFKKLNEILSAMEKTVQFRSL